MELLVFRTRHGPHSEPGPGLKGDGGVSEPLGRIGWSCRTVPSHIPDLEASPGPAFCCVSVQSRVNVTGHLQGSADSPETGLTWILSDHTQLTSGPPRDSRSGVAAPAQVGTCPGCTSFRRDVLTWKHRNQVSSRTGPRGSSVRGFRGGLHGPPVSCVPTAPTFVPTPSRR